MVIINFENMLTSRLGSSGKVVLGIRFRDPELSLSDSSTGVRPSRNSVSLSST